MQTCVQTKWPQKAFASVVALAISGVVSVSSAQTAPPETGVWIDDTGKGAVRIEVCGGKLCGRIVWLKALVNDNGEVLRDRHNPDPAMRDRLICGLPILGQLQALPEGGYDGGWVYDPKVGKAFDVAIQLTGRDQLTVTGYKGIRLFSKSFIWTRAKTELPDCAEGTAQLTGAAPTAAPTPKKTVKPTTAAKTVPATKAAATPAAVPAPKKAVKPTTAAKTAPATKAVAAPAKAETPAAATKSVRAEKSAAPQKKAGKKEVLPWAVAEP